MCSSELNYYPVYEPGTRLLEPGYPDLVVSVRVRVRHKIFGYITKRLCWFYNINLVTVSKLYSQNYFVTVTNICL